MDMIINGLKWVVNQLGMNIPNIAKHDMSAAEPDETSAERKSRFAEMVAVEEEIKEDLAYGTEEETF
jgi:hypothetical protein